MPQLWTSDGATGTRSKLEAHHCPSCGDLMGWCDRSSCWRHIMDGTPANRDCSSLGARTSPAFSSPSRDQQLRDYARRYARG